MGGTAEPRTWRCASSSPASARAQPSSSARAPRSMAWRFAKRSPAACMAASRLHGVGGFSAWHFVGHMHGCFTLCKDAELSRALQSAPLLRLCFYFSPVWVVGLHPVL